MPPSTSPNIVLTYFYVILCDHNLKNYRKNNLRVVVFFRKRLKLPIPDSFESDGNGRPSSSSSSCGVQWNSTSTPRHPPQCTIQGLFSYIETTSSKPSLFQIQRDDDRNDAISSIFLGSPTTETLVLVVGSCYRC